MADHVYRVVGVPGVRQGRHRGLCYVICDGDPDINASETVEDLWDADDDEKRKVWSRFDHWIDGGVQDSYFHGWNEAGYEHCFTFKWNKAKAMRRFYGFLMHPKPKSNPRYQLCVLFSYAIKVGKYTDPEQKAKAESLFRDAALLNAIKKTFPDK